MIIIQCAKDWHFEQKSLELLVEAPSTPSFTGINEDHSFASTWLHMLWAINWEREKNTNSLYKCSFWVILHIWTRHNAEISISYRPECLLNYYLQNEKSITIILLNDSFYMLQTLASCQIEQFIMQSKAKRCDAMCSAQIHGKTPVCQRQSTIRSKNVCECANIPENVWPQGKHNQTETNTIRRNAKQFSALFVWFVPNKLRMKNYGNKKLRIFNALVYLLYWSDFWLWKIGFQAIREFWE